MSSAFLNECQRIGWEEKCEDQCLLQVIGNGSFGVVYQAKLCETGEMVAIKKVLQVCCSIKVLYEQLISFRQFLWLVE